MNDDFLEAARRFGDAPRVINQYDLGIAFFLEYFAMPVLRFGTYVPLRRRQLMPELAVEFRDWISHHLPDEVQPDWPTLAEWAKTAIDGPAKQQEFLEVVGHSCHRRNQTRHQEMYQANRVSTFVLWLALVVHGVVLSGILVTKWWLITLWLAAMLLASLICWFDLHWRPKLATYK